MKTTSKHRAATVLAAGALLALPAASLADATPHHGSPSSWPIKDYDMNAATGDYAPPRPGARSTGVASASPADGFSWSDAAAGAGLVLLASGGLAYGGRIVVRRRRTPAQGETLVASA